MVSASNYTEAHALLQPASTPFESVNKYISDQLQHKCIRVIEFYRTDNNQIRLIEEVKNTTPLWDELGLALKSSAPFYTKIISVLYLTAQALLSAIVRILTIARSILGIEAAESALQAAVALEQDLSSDGYYQWRLDAIRQNVMPSYLQTLEREDLNLVDFCCPITHELIMCPYKAPSGRVYEKAAILEHLRSARARADAESDPVLREEVLREISPFRGEFFTESDLDYDWKYHSRVCERLNALLGDGVDALPEVVREGLQKFRKSIRTSSLQIMNNLTLVINQMFAEDRIDQETAGRRIHEIYTQYQPFFGLRRGVSDGQETV